MSDIKQEIEKGIYLLWLCQKLQSEKDGIERPTHFDLDKSKTLDQFARDVSRSATNMAALTSAFFFLQGGVAAGVIIGLAGLLFLGMGIFPRTSEELPMTRRWIIGFTLLLFGVIATLSYFE
ncbi:hypothetical protein ACODM8_16160 [Vibrio ostreicida]|uniref:hypothetical protein n=1 Tax=Vibrio ostreicida TaxID=526588 RepID=UPI003B5BA194